MKGIVFTELMDMVETTLSADVLDDVLARADLPNGGAYTAVGTYDHAEMVALLAALSERTGIPIPDLLRQFGVYLFGRFAALYPAFFQAPKNALDFLAGIESVIHTEVLKLYPDAQLPRFDVAHRDASRLVLEYRSVRHLEDLAEGLIRGCIAHFGGNASLARETLGSGESRCERFTVTQQPG